MLADGGIIDLIALKIAACGARPVALTSAERQLAAARILAQGGTPYLISKPLHVRRDGRGWRTTSDALLALSPAARTRESTSASPARNWPTPSEEKENPAMNKILLTVPEAAAALAISRSKLYELLAAGVVRSVRIDGSRRVPVEALEAYVASLLEEEASADAAAS